MRMKILRSPCEMECKIISPHPRLSGTSFTNTLSLSQEPHAACSIVPRSNFPSKFGVGRKMGGELVLATVSAIGDTKIPVEAVTTTVGEGVGAEDGVALAI